MKSSYELQPNDRHKSFYGKAVVKVNRDGSETLYSYGTQIITRDAAGGLHRHYIGTYSCTTGRHVKAFCGLSKKDFEALPVDGGKGTYNPSYESSLL